jgi:hypothetical protein
MKHFTVYGVPTSGKTYLLRQWVKMEWPVMDTDNLFSAIDPNYHQRRKQGVVDPAKHHDMEKLVLEAALAFAGNVHMVTNLPLSIEADYYFFRDEQSLIAEWQKRDNKPISRDDKRMLSHWAQQFEKRASTLPTAKVFWLAEGEYISNVLYPSKAGLRISNQYLKGQEKTK